MVGHICSTLPPLWLDSCVKRDSDTQTFPLDQVKHQASIAWIRCVKQTLRQSWSGCSPPCHTAGGFKICCAITEKTCSLALKIFLKSTLVGTWPNLTNVTKSGPDINLANPKYSFDPRPNFVVCNLSLFLQWPQNQKLILAQTSQD